MDILRIFLLLLVTAGFCTTGQALTITPADCTPANLCLTSNDNGSADDVVFPVLSGMDLLYKFETGIVGETPSPTALLADSYDTVDIVMEGPDDYLGATVRYVGGDFVDCAFPCYLTVKDGRVGTPARYLFDLAVFGWDGMEDLVLANFWPGQGSLSNFAIYGNSSPIPVPAAFWLFGTALIGFIGLSRRMSL